jgi:hypothetical protein
MAGTAGFHATTEDEAWRATIAGSYKTVLAPPDSVAAWAGSWG